VPDYALRHNRQFLSRLHRCEPLSPRARCPEFGTESCRFRERSSPRKWRENSISRRNAARSSRPLWKHDGLRKGRQRKWTQKTTRVSLALHRNKSHSYKCRMV